MTSSLERARDRKRLELTNPIDSSSKDLSPVRPKTKTTTPSSWAHETLLQVLQGRFSHVTRREIIAALKRARFHGGLAANDLAERFPKNEPARSTERTADGSLERNWILGLHCKKSCSAKPLNSPARFSARSPMPVHPSGGSVEPEVRRSLPGSMPLTPPSRRSRAITGLDRIRRLVADCALEVLA